MRLYGRKRLTVGDRTLAQFDYVMPNGRQYALNQLGSFYDDRTLTLRKFTLQWLSFSQTAGDLSNGW
jgi:hypothetical protein